MIRNRLAGTSPIPKTNSILNSYRLLYPTNVKIDEIVFRLFKMLPINFNTGGGSFASEFNSGLVVADRVRTMPSQEIAQEDALKFCDTRHSENTQEVECKVSESGALLCNVISQTWITRLTGGMVPQPVTDAILPRLAHPDVD
jgi:hypothetical protein